MPVPDHNGLAMLQTTDLMEPYEGAINLVTASVSNKFDEIDPGLIHVVADIPARTALAGTFTPTPAKPLYVHRQNAGTGLELEVTTDGTNWRTIRPFGPGQPWAEAAGQFSVPAQTIAPNALSPAYTVNLPSGRFSDAPIINLQLYGVPGGSVGLEPRVSGYSASSFTLYLSNVSSLSRTILVPIVVFWRAVQMTPTTAAG